MRPLRHHHREMRAHDIQTLMLHHLSCACGKLLHIRRNYAHVHISHYRNLRKLIITERVECHLLHVSHLHQVTLSFQIVLISSLSKVSPFPG